MFYFGKLLIQIQKKDLQNFFSLCEKDSQSQRKERRREERRRKGGSYKPICPFDRQNKQQQAKGGERERFQGREIKETKKDFFPPPRYSQLTSDFSTPFSFSFFCYVLAGTVPYHLLLLINKHGLSFVPFRHTPTLTMPFFFFFVLVTFSHFFSSIIIVYIIIIVTVLVINLLRLKYNPLT